MIPDFNRDGTLPAGIHSSGWEEVESRFGFSERRLQLLGGLKSALRALRRAWCRRVYIDGSFVTVKREPGDYDACWDIECRYGILGFRFPGLLERAESAEAEVFGRVLPSSDAGGRKQTTISGLLPDGQRNR